MPKNSNGSKRQTGSHRWCFTWNNYPEDWADVIRERVDAVKVRFPLLKWIGGEEVAPTTGTKHIQGYMEFTPSGPDAKRVRPVSALGLPKEVHWGDKNGKPCRGSRQDNINYCSKECGNLVSTFKIPKSLWVPEIRGWQLEAAELLKVDPLLDTRSIHWFWEPNGNMGKSSFARWAIASHALKGTPEEIVLVGGKAADMKHAIAGHKEKYGEYPTKIIVDIPRESLQYVSYAGLEEVRNGLFFSGKYESGMVLMNPPTMLVLANSPPEEGKWSQDRIKQHKLVSI